MTLEYGDERFYEVVAHYIDPELDTDGDGLTDWFEMHYLGSLVHDAEEDLDGDGLTLAVEEAHELHPKLFDSIHVTEIVQGTSIPFNFRFKDIANQNAAPTGLTSTTIPSLRTSPPTTIGTLTAIDPDEGDTHTITLTDPSQHPDNAHFTIDGDGWCFSQLRL